MPAAESPVIVDVPPPAPPPAPTTELHITPDAIESGPTPPPPKPGSARENVFKNLRQRAGVEETPTPPAKPEAPKPEAKKPTAPPPTQPKTEQVTPPTEPKKPEDGKQVAPPPQPKPGEKVNPWKLVDDYKSRLSTLERELAEAKTASVPEQEKKAWTEKSSAMETRLKELEEEIRFVNYEKSSEFKTKYQEPYERAWTLAMDELSELVVTDPATGEGRAATANDLLELANLPLGRARELATEKFGDFADDVMAHRKTVRTLFQQRQAALEEARKTGAEREKLLTAAQQKAQTEMAEKIKATWEKALKEHEEDPKYGKYFKPVEGDMEGNQKLAKGYALVERAWNEDPRDPNLTAEQRESIIKRHAAVRNRAAAFGRLRWQKEQLETELAAVRAELTSYKNGEPTTQGSTTPQGQPHRSARDSIFDALRQKAVPG